MARYYVQTMRRSPSNPMSSVSFYDVVDGEYEKDGRRGVACVERFSVRTHGAAEALRLANDLRDRLNGAQAHAGRQITDAEVRAYILRVAEADRAAGIE